MATERGPYFNLSDRLDILADRFASANLDNAIAAIVAENPEWNGLQYLPSASLPTSVGPQRAENLRAEAKELKAQLVSETPIQLATHGQEDQLHEDGARFATPQESAWWAAEVLVLMPKGSIYGDAELGTTILRDALETAVSTRMLRQLEQRSAQAMASANPWFAVRSTTADFQPPTLIELLARLQLQPYTEESQ